MPNSESRYSPEEVARRGDEIYERDLRARLEPDHLGKIVAIDVGSGAHAVADTALAASRDLRTRQPAADVWLVRIGHRAIHRIGRAYTQLQVRILLSIPDRNWGMANPLR